MKVEGLTIVSTNKEYASVLVEGSNNILLKDLHISGGHSVWLEDSKDVRIEDCRVTGAEWGIAENNSLFKASRSLIYKNEKRGVSVQEKSVVTIESNTIVDNKRAGIGIYDSEVEVYNNLIAFNPWNMGCADCKYSGGYNNFYEGTVSDVVKKPTDSEMDPLFVGRLNGDYRLSPESPLVNKGRGGTYIGAFPPVGLAPGTGEFK